MKNLLIKSTLIFFLGIIVLLLFFKNDHWSKDNQTASLVEVQKIVKEVSTQLEILETQESEENKKDENEKKLYSVIKVVDGDTLALDIDGQSQTLRLIGIDTPETVDPRKPVQCFGVEASNKAKEVLTGQKVSIEKDSTQGDLDKYNRLLVYVFLEDGTNFNKMMIEEGYAYEYTYDLPYKYQTEFKLAEKLAREEERGLWSLDTCNGETANPQGVVVEQVSLTTGSKPIKNDCSANVYNCTDFKTHIEAQATYEY